jgi:hypothetical protein
MEENWYLITSESVLIKSEPTMLVSESLTFLSESVEVSESYYSGSQLVFDTGSVIATDIIWSVDVSKILFGTPTLYTGSYITYFESYDSVIGWIYDPNTDEEKNWNPDYVDPNDDPYGIDGPFPEEMDETII